MPFRFIGVPYGASPGEPRISADATELRAPLEPAYVQEVLGRPVVSAGPDRCMLVIPDWAPIRAIPLQGGEWCIVSAHRYAWASQWRWNAGFNSRRARRYAKRNEGTARTTLYLHREIMKLKSPGDREFLHAHHAHHVNGCPFDNTDDNLGWLQPIANMWFSIPEDETPTVEECAQIYIEAAEAADLARTF